MTEYLYLTADHLAAVAEHAVEGRVLLRDPSLLASAAERPQTVLFGQEQFPTLLDKAAALMHSLARFHPLIDGNKRLAWLATITFLELNGASTSASVDEWFDFTIAVASGELSEVADIAKALAPLVQLPAELPTCAGDVSVRPRPRPRAGAEAVLPPQRSPLLHDVRALGRRCSPPPVRSGRVEPVASCAQIRPRRDVRSSLSGLVTFSPGHGGRTRMFRA